MTDWQQNISEQSKEVVEINSEIFPSDGSLNCAVTGTKEEKHWHAKCFKSYVTGCLYCKELLCTRMSYSLLCFTLMEKGNPQAQTWLWISPVVREALSGASYIILYLSHIPMWISALPCEKSQEKGTFKRRNNFYKDKLFPRKVANNGVQILLAVTCDVLSDHNSNSTRSKYLNNYASFKHRYYVHDTL